VTGTLFITPVIYVYFEHLREHVYFEHLREGWAARRAGSRAARGAIAPLHG
jgi:hypothetical protein